MKINTMTICAYKRRTEVGAQRAVQPDRALVRQPRAKVFWCWRSRIEKGGRNCLLGP
jgi:hypothetical protein